MDGARKGFRFSLSGATLKYIAVFTMLLDHIGAGLIESGILYHYDGTEWVEVIDAVSTPFWYSLDLVLRGAGRLAFPLFCFLLAEGFLHTGNAGKYVTRLVFFAFISEIPFDLLFSNRLMDFDGQNVFFTLSIGLLTLIALKRFEYEKTIQVFTVVLGCGAALLLKTDYGMIGVLLIVSFYLLRDDRTSLYLVSGALMVYESIDIYGLAVLALLPISFYNGQRGRTKLKYAFYWFYPAHLFLLFLFRCFVPGTGLS